MKTGAVKSYQSNSSPKQDNIPTRRPGAVLLLSFSIVVCVILFLLLDAAYSAFVLRARPAISAAGTCFKADVVRHHSLQANCTCERHWGRNSYRFATNSLGFRDENIRQVPLTSEEPRILLLGDSYTEGMSAWPDTYVGQITAKFPQYEFLNGGIESYAPSNYLNVARQVIAKGVKFDEAIVFIDISDAQDEAAFYQDKSPTGAVEGPAQIVHNGGLYTTLREFIIDHLLITNGMVDLLERQMVKHGHYYLNVGHGQLFDLPRSAWTYRAVSDTEPYEIGYAPLGLEAGLRKEESKMTALWKELRERDIPVSVVVYPWPAQVAHDSVDSRQVTMWRDWCAGKCARFITVFPEFLAVKEACPANQAGCWYMKDFIFGDEHYSRAGNAIVADAVAKSLESALPKKVE